MPEHGSTSTATTTADTIDFSLLLRELSTQDVDHTASPLLRVVYFVLIDGCLDNLDIVKSSYGSVTGADQEILTTDYISPEARFGFGEKAVLDENLKFRLGHEPTDYERLQKIVCSLMLIMKVGATQLMLNGRWGNFEEALNNLQRMKDDEALVLTNEIEINQIFKDLSHLYVAERIRLTTEIKETEGKIMEAKTALQTFKQKSIFEETYYNKWEESRCEQRLQKLTDEEEAYINSINTNTQNIKNEEACHVSFERFLNENTQDLLDSIEVWMEKYELDMADKELEILRAKDKVTEITDSIAELQGQHDDHERQMNEWLEYERQKHETEKREDLRLWAATKIQAWWRGIYMRLRVHCMKRKLKKRGKKSGKKRGKKSGKRGGKKGGKNVGKKRGKKGSAHSEKKSSKKGGKKKKRK